MAGTGLNEWNVDPDAETLNYHLRQYDQPYRSTVHFAKFCDFELKNAKSVIDAGCGAGAPTAYLAKTYPNCRFLGLDVSVNLIAQARKALVCDNHEVEVDDLDNLKERFGVDGVTLIQVLSWLPTYEMALHQIATRLRPKWIAFSTLIYQGDIDCQIVVTEHQRPRRSFYNIYGLPQLNRFMAGEGYQLNKCEPFQIDMALPLPSTRDLMATYTLPANGAQLQLSGPLLLPWHFAMYHRSK